MDDKYTTQLALANISSEVWLGTDANDDTMDVLINKPQSELDKIIKFEIPNNKNITDDKLQTLLKKLTNLQLLQADNSNLKSFDFIEKENDEIEQISVFSTTIKDLTNLEKCKNLWGLRINTVDLNLKNYSKIISDICSRGSHSSAQIASGSFNIGGICTTNTILNTLNGTPGNINNDFKYFTIYYGGGDGSDIDFTYTGLTAITDFAWVNGKIILPASFKSFKTGGLTTTLDYRNLQAADYYNANGTSASSVENFSGYREVTTPANPVAIIGSSTETLKIGTCNYTKTNDNYPKSSFNLKSIIAKAPNITNMTIWGTKGIMDIKDLKTLSLTRLEIQYSSIYGLKSQTTDFGNMAKTLKTLKINNCTSFNDLDGLDKLTGITTLDLTNDSSLGSIQTVENSNGQKESKNTCQYIIDSLPNLNKVILKGCDISDFTVLTSYGFRENSSGSREFTRATN